METDMKTYCEQRPVEEREAILSLIDNGEITIHKGALKLGTPYTTIVSRIYRGSTVRQAFMDPIIKRSQQGIGNAAWQALSDEVR
jgi:hypothetical protein